MTADAATLIEHLATELEQALRYEGEDILTIPEAAEISRRSPGHLRDLVRAKRIRNAGRPDAPRISRADRFAYFPHISPPRTAAPAVHPPSPRQRKRQLHVDSAVVNKHITKGKSDDGDDKKTQPTESTHAQDGQRTWSVAHQHARYPGIVLSELTVGSLYLIRDKKPGDDNQPEDEFARHQACRPW
jgi:hypothetical protein